MSKRRADPYPGQDELAADPPRPPRAHLRRLPDMAETYSEFLAEHRAEHRSAFNRGTLVVGDAMQLLGAVSLLARRRRFGLTMLTLGLGITAAGHVRDGNLP